MRGKEYDGHVARPQDFPGSLRTVDAWAEIDIHEDEIEVAGIGLEELNGFFAILRVDDQVAGAGKLLGLAQCDHGLVLNEENPRSLIRLVNLSGH